MTASRPLTFYVLVGLLGRLVERRGILPREAGHAKLTAAAGLQQRRGREEYQRISADLLTHGLGILAGRDQFVIGRGVHAVEAGIGHRGTGDAHVHFGGSRLLEHRDDAPRSRAAHDRVVDQHHALAPSANTLYANPELLEYSHWRKGKEIELYNFACNHLLLEAFFSTLGFTKEKRVPIDVLMFTGRASQLTGLADKIISNINTKWRKQLGRKYNVISLTGDQRKTVVAEGALNYANIKYQRMEGVTFVRNKIYARYGVMYNNGGDWVFEEILGPNSTIKPQQNILYDNTIKINNTQRGAIHIVRTYDKKPEIVWKAMQQDNPSLKTENDSLYQAVNYTTVLYTQQPNFDPNMNQDLAIRLQITNNMDLLISITDCNLGTAIDIMVGACVSEEKNSNISFKKSIWPSLEQ